MRITEDNSGSPGALLCALNRLIGKLLGEGPKYTCSAQETRAWAGQRDRALNENSPHD